MKKTLTDKKRNPEDFELWMKEGEGYLENFMKRVILYIRGIEINSL